MNRYNLTESSSLTSCVSFLFFAILLFCFFSCKGLKKGKEENTAAHANKPEYLTISNTPMLQLTIAEKLCTNI